MAVPLNKAESDHRISVFGRKCAVKIQRSLVNDYGNVAQS